MKILEGDITPITVYPWAEWADGRTRVAEQGVDYFIPTKSFQALVYKYAKKKGLLVRTSISGETVTFRFARRGEGDEQQPDA